MGEKSPFFRAWFGDWRAYDKNKLSLVNNTNRKSFKAGKTINIDTGRSISWGDQIKGETKIKYGTESDVYGFLENIEEIVKTSILLDTNVSVLSSKSKMNNTVFMHSMYSLVEDNSGNICLVKLLVEEAFNDKMTSEFSRAYELQEIKKVATLYTGVHSKDGGLTRQVTTNYSICDLFDFVKQYDKSFVPKAVDKHLVNEDGTPKKFYHGTNEKFTEFNPDEIALREGSFFFAENREATKEVGEQIARAAASGALMGFGFGAGGSVIGLSSSQISNAQKGNAILKDPTKIEALKTLALNSEFKDIAKEAESLSADSKPTQVGAVFNKLFEKTWEKSKTALESELMTKGATKYGTNSASGLAMRILKTATTPKGKGSTMAEGMLSANSIAGETYKAFVNEGKFGGSEVLALNEILTSPSKQKTIQGKTQSAKDDAAVSDAYTVEEAFSGFSDEVITDALRHSKKNDNSNVPIHVFGISKGSSLYKKLSAAGLVDNNGNVSVQAIKNEYDKRMGIRKKESTVTATYGKSVTEHLEKERPKSQKNKQKNKTWLQKALDNAKINSEARSDDDGSTNADILAGGRVSASGKGKNRVRTYGANTEIIRQFLGRLNQNKKNKARTLAAGDSAWLSKPDFEPAAQVGGGLRESFLRNIQRVVSNGFDSIGRILSPELQEKVSDTVFMEDDGTVFSFFHWSPNKFDEFKYGDGAFHCGTLMSAIATKERSDEKVDGYLKEMYVISKKPFIIEDVGRFGAYSVAVKLEEYGIIDHNDLLRISEMDGFFSDQYDAEANVYVRGILESLGYDSYLYQNIKEDPGSWSVGVFNADQIITIAENGVLKENCGVTEADSNDGSVFNLSDSEDTMADADVQNDNYAKEDKYWEAENENERKVSKGLFDKIKNLFSNNKDEDSITSIGDIVKQIEKDFGVPVSTGKFKQKAYGIYKNKTEAIRTKVSNALPTIAHEIGHHMDKRYGLRKLATITEAIQVLKDSRPDFYASYKQSAIPAEAVAEFIRDYLADRTLAKNKYPNFFAEFESTLLASKEGKKDLENLKSIGDMINRYFVAEKQERVRAAVKSRTDNTIKTNFAMQYILAKCIK